MLQHKKEELSIQEYLELCKSDPSVYASAPERMLLAIGEPELVDTARDPRFAVFFPTKSSNATKRSRIFMAWMRPSNR